MVMFPSASIYFDLPAKILYYFLFNNYGKLLAYLSKAMSVMLKADTVVIPMFIPFSTEHRWADWSNQLILSGGSMNSARRIQTTPTTTSAQARLHTYVLARVRSAGVRQIATMVVAFADVMNRDRQRATKKRPMSESLIMVSRCSSCAVSVLLSIVVKSSKI